MLVIQRLDKDVCYIEMEQDVSYIEMDQDVS